MTGYELAKLIGQIPTTMLPRAERAVLKAMAEHHPRIWPSAATLGREAGYSPKITSGALTKLLHRKVIALANGSTRKGGRNKTTRYVINVEAVLALVPPKRNPVQQKPETLSKGTGNPVILERNTGTTTGLRAETLSKGQTNKPATPNKTENKTNNKGGSPYTPIVEKTLESLLLLFYEEEKPTVMKHTEAHDQKLTPIIVGYGPVFVTAAWKKYLKVRDSKESWPLVQFTKNFAVYLKMAENETFKLREKLFWGCPFPPEGYWLPELEFYPHTPEEVAAIESLGAWKKAHRDDPDMQKAFGEMPLNNAGILLDLMERDAAWEAEHKEEIERLEDEWHKQQEKDDPDGTRYIDGEQ